MHEVPSSIGEALRRDQKLCKSADYLRCYRQGRKRHGSLAILYFQSTAEQGNLTPAPSPATRQARLGITASRKVGHAVLRNRTKRRIREIFRRWPLRGQLSDLDIVVHLKPDASKVVFAELRAEIERLLGQLPRRKVIPAGSPDATPDV